MGTTLFIQIPHIKTVWSVQTAQKNCLKETVHTFVQAQTKCNVYTKIKNVFKELY
uniref:Uncharacterized protein n=1 Tax=Arion vulgaris TaxID=1028688 RepID=A0A0B6XZV6_9EUPU